MSVMVIARAPPAGLHSFEGARTQGSSMKLHRQTVVIGGLCLLDLASTLWVVAHYSAAEANPLMAFCLGHGTATFVGAKILLSLLPLMMIEWAWRRRPRFVRRAANVAIAAYLGCYILGVQRANSVRMPADWERTERLRLAAWRTNEKAIQEKRARSARQLAYQSARPIGTARSASTAVSPESSPSRP